MTIRIIQEKHNNFTDKCLLNNSPNNKWHVKMKFIYNKHSNLKHMTSSSSYHVTTRLESSFGTGNKCFNIQRTRWPNLEFNPLNIWLGYVWGIFAPVPQPIVSISWRVRTLYKVNIAVGPNGKWLIIKVSGTPRDSLTITISVIWNPQEKYTHKGQ